MEPRQALRDDIRRIERHVAQAFVLQLATLVTMLATLVALLLR